MSSIDEQFVEFVVKSLVNSPDEVKIERRIDEKGVLLELTVDPEDLGRVIGKRGATAQSIRTLLRALGTKNDARYNLKIVDNGTPHESRPPRDDYQAPTNDSPVSDDGASDASSDDHSSPQADDNSQVANDEDNAAYDKAVEEAAAVPSEDNSHEEQTSDRLSKARKELEEFDDLDV
jgi:predicted RNA-binding protein YlqC (UPF0109 family)